MSPMKDPCYLFVKTPMLNYDAAAQDCQAMGGTLAQIKSAAENDFVKGLMVSVSPDLANFHLVNNCVNFSKSFVQQTLSIIINQCLLDVWR